MKRKVARTCARQNQSKTDFLVFGERYTEKTQFYLFKDFVLVNKNLSNFEKFTNVSARQGFSMIM